MKVHFDHRRGVRPDDLPPEVRRLLWYHVDSIDKLRILQYAARALAPWTVAQAAAELRLGERATMIATVGLCQADLLRRASDSLEQTERTAIVAAALEVLGREYGREPVQLLDAIRRAVHGRS